mmetsp:Transcript_113902/g.302690  ORF Transcript_113902/g.302690 Transcript_113902/m.302690 type:complete len:92 (+) Transcript_113902:34-309(+)
MRRRGRRLFACTQEGLLVPWAVDRLSRARLASCCAFRPADRAGGVGIVPAAVPSGAFARILLGTMLCMGNANLTCTMLAAVPHGTLAAWGS